MRKSRVMLISGGWHLGQSPKLVCALSAPEEIRARGPIRRAVCVCSGQRCLPGASAGEDLPCLIQGRAAPPQGCSALISPDARAVFHPLEVGLG
jgi:hypothetical protein